METLKGIFQCPQKLTNVIQTSQNSPWLSLRSLNKWYGVFAPQYYKFSHLPCLLAVVGSLGGGISVLPKFTDQAGAVLLLLWLFWMSTVWLDAQSEELPTRVCISLLERWVPYQV